MPILPTLCPDCATALAPEDDACPECGRPLTERRAASDTVPPAGPGVDAGAGVSAVASPQVDAEPDALLDANAAARERHRAEHVDVLQAAIAEAVHAGGMVQLAFRSRSDDSGIVTGAITFDDLPGDRVRADVRIRLAYFGSGDDWNLARAQSGRWIILDRRRTFDLMIAGWDVADDASRSWEVDPAIGDDVAQLVDGIQDVLEMSGLPLGVEWAARVRQPEPPSVGDAAIPPVGAIAPDEPWLEDATAGALRARIARLAGMRGGRIAVRRTFGPSPTVTVTARRGRRASMHVEAKEDAAPGLPRAAWRQRWTVAGPGVDIDAIFATLEDRLLGPGTSGGDWSISLRLETAAATRAWMAESYGFLLAWFAASVAAAALLLVAGGETLPDTDSVGWVSAFAIALTAILVPDTDSVGWVSAFAIALTAILPASFAVWCVRRIADARRWRYEPSEWLGLAVSTVATTAFFLVVHAAGSSWVFVVAMPWILAIGWYGVGERMVRRVRRRT